jgi:hypothetical protein
MKKFYDIHFHSLNLSHANLLAFLNRDDLITTQRVKNALKKAFKWYNIIPACTLRLFSKKVKNAILEQVNEHSNIINLLSFMGSSYKDNFLLIEHFLKTKDSLVENNKLKLNNTSYDKLVICPLIMDFGMKNQNMDNIFYNIPTRKPVHDQIVDLLNSINYYYTHEYRYDESDNKYRIHKSNTNKKERLLEIYPFMGMNTQNYSIRAIEKILDRYFEGFENDTPEERYKKLQNKMGDFANSSLERELNPDYDFRYLFAGIKVYPPLGFSPWPKDKIDELEKVKLLYKICSERRIPIITHCSDGGFKTVKRAQDFSNPGNEWKEVLENYPDLIVNYAHLGNQDKSNEWENQIIDYATDNNKKIYTDISCMAKDDDYYKKVSNIIEKHPDMEDKILFGTDFVINLIWSESYNEYLKALSQTNHLSDNQKQKLCSHNAEKFLYGGVIDYGNIEKKEEVVTETV